MWVIPFVSGSGQCPAVNLAAAWKLEIQPAYGSNQYDRMSIYAYFGTMNLDRDNGIPICEYIKWDNSNPPVDKGYEYGDHYLQKILSAIKTGVPLLDIEVDVMGITRASQSSL